MTAKKTITSTQIAVKAGAKANSMFASNRLRTDKTFPRPMSCMGGKGKQSLWFEADIDVWLAKRAARPKNTGKPAIAPRPHLDLALAQQFIRTLTITL
jgi:predicted DNA-binding transcriptional regulator AlpA